jgi:hypothetical protein
MLKSFPASILMIFVMPETTLTGTGVVLLPVVPSPNCPESFDPHAQTRPSSVSANV